MRELLIRYLLGELDAAQQRQLEERLRNSSELARELAYLRTCFAAARDEDAGSDRLPRGLAERTAQRVADADCCEELGSAADMRLRTSSAAAVDSPPGSLGWSLADLTVAGGVFLAVSMLVIPALRESRDATRATICQDRQQQMFVLFAGLAEINDDYFPRIREGMNAGMFAVELLDKGLAEADELAMLLVCPAAPLADKVRAGEFAVHVPTMRQLAVMPPRELAEARQKMSPFYAYHFPYQQGNRYFYRPHKLQASAPILCDTSEIVSNEMVSANHHGVVQVLFGDGSVRLFRSCRVPAFDDDLYRNERGMVAAGCGSQDAVLGRSEAVLPRIDFAALRE
jgi:hypothetical protein